MVKVNQKSHNHKHRILVVIRWPVGGIRTFIGYVFSNFNALLYDLTVIAPDIPETKILLNDLSKYQLTYMPYKNSLSIMGIATFISKTILTKPFDLIYSHGFTAALCSVPSARFRKIPHVMTCHDVLLGHQFAGFSGYLKIKMLKILLPWVDVIHYVSNDVYYNLLKYIPVLENGRERDVVIPNGIRINDFREAKNRNLRRELGLSGNSFIVGYLGRFMPQKGFGYLIEAMELLLKKYELPKKPIVLAFGDGGYVREEKENIKKRGLEKHVLFQPFTQNIASTLKGLDVVAMPSLWEACPLLPMEAMVVGVPVIGTNCIGLREVLRDTISVIVPSGDCKALAEAIAGEMRKSSLEKAKMFVDEAIKRFDVNNQAIRLERVIHELIDQR